ncbi:MAG: anti-sigma regulatory factor [Methanotrichaceae archaeon]
MRLDRHHIDIKCAGDVSIARNCAKNMARMIGFGPTASEEISLVVSELASNLIKHAEEGSITLLPLAENDYVGVQIESEDKGPGIENVEQAMADGFSTVGSLGFGLGTANRLMDEFTIASQCRQPDRGTHIICKRFVKKDKPKISSCPLEFGIATRAHPMMNVNGDTFVIKQWGTSALIGVIDGVGHGQYALRAAQAARQYIETHYDQPLSSIFLGVGRACRATRGVVMSLARFDWTEDLSAINLTFSGIGNVEMRVVGKQEPMKFLVRRGILGVNATNPIVTEHPWKPNYVMVLHSDGISAHWNWTDFPEIAQASAEVAARRLLQRLAREDDDATAIVVRGRNPRVAIQKNEDAFDPSAEGDGRL